MHEGSTRRQFVGGTLATAAAAAPAPGGLPKGEIGKLQSQEDRGVPACLLVPDLIRAPMARLLRRAAPRLKVLGHSEIPETHSIRIGSIIGGTA